MIPNGFKPMLAAKADVNALTYPLLVSPKLDGIRAVVLGGRLLSRTLKPIPNQFIQDTFAPVMEQLEGMDGELIVGDPTAKDVFQVTTSGVMGRDGTPEFRFYVFDVLADSPFYNRFTHLALQSQYFPNWVTLVKQEWAMNRVALEHQEQLYVSAGFEGAMLRDPHGRYKFGRSTMKEGLLLKLKRFEDDEGIIVGFEEKEHNDNRMEKDERGYAKRSSAKAGKRPAGTLGTLLLECENWPDIVRVGSGLNDALRADIWNHKSKYRGKLVKFRYQAVGVKDMPRQPIFIGFRDKRDLSD